MNPKILFFDIETAPMVTYSWSIWREARSTDFVISDWHILCWCGIWHGENHGVSSCLAEYPSYLDDPRDDHSVVSCLWHALDEADVVVAHNARFDVGKANARFAHHNLPAPSPFRVIDTLKIARRMFGFTSNRLNDLGVHLGLGGKEDTGGFQLWKDVLDGDSAAWETMVRYCSRDVVLLKGVYEKLAPYGRGLPNLGAYIDSDVPACPRCLSTDLVRRGFAYTQLSSCQRYRCRDCGAWARDRSRTGRPAALANV